MGEAVATALKLLLTMLPLALGIAAFDLGLIQPRRIPPCNPATLEKGHICLSQVLENWRDKVIWVDARKQDDFERRTIAHAPVYSIRPSDSRYQELLAQAMESLIDAGDKGFCIVIFCGRDCASSSSVANELKKPEYGIDAPIYILDGGWEELRREPSLIQ